MSYSFPADKIVIHKKEIRDILEIDKCKDYADERVKDTYYNKNRNANPETRWSNEYLGKLGEYGAWYFLGKTTPQPDVSIYKRHQKNYSPDLGDFGVKTAIYTSKYRRGKSRTFEETDTIFNSKKQEPIVLVYVVNYIKWDAPLLAYGRMWCGNNPIAIIYATTPFGLIVDFLEGPENGNSGKKCLYEDTLVKLYKDQIN